MLIIHQRKTQEDKMISKKQIRLTEQNAQDLKIQSGLIGKSVQFIANEIIKKSLSKVKALKNIKRKW